MRLVKADKNKLFKRTVLFALLDDFAASGFECAKIEGGRLIIASPASDNLQ